MLNTIYSANNGDEELGLYTSWDAAFQTIKNNSYYVLGTYVARCFYMDNDDVDKTTPENMKVFLSGIYRIYLEVKKEIECASNPEEINYCFSAMADQVIQLGNSKYLSEFYANVFNDSDEYFIHREKVAKTPDVKIVDFEVLEKLKSFGE